MNWVPPATQDVFAFLNPPNPEAIAVGEMRITTTILMPKSNANN